MMISNSNTTTNFAVIVTLTASSIASFNYDSKMESGMDLQHLNNIKYSKKYIESNDLYNGLSTNTIVWNDYDLSKFDSNTVNERFMTFNSFSEIFDISNNLFSNSRVLDGELHQAIVNTINKIGKSKTTLPNRL